MKKDIDRTGRPGGCRLGTWLAATDAEVRAAQQLRYRVFAEELHAQLDSGDEGLDRDRFDDYCDHLLVGDREAGEVVATYRILPGFRALALGGFYTESEFDLRGIAALPRLVEVGRACVHPAHRNGIAIRLLLGGLASYVVDRGYEFVIGCASVPTDGAGASVTALHRELEHHRAPQEFHVTPHRPFPLGSDASDSPGGLPPLIKAYLRIGAWVCGAPAWDPKFRTADFFMMLSTARMRTRYASRLLRAA